jgi:hypothetical protein
VALARCRPQAPRRLKIGSSRQWLVEVHIAEFRLSLPEIEEYSLASASSLNNEKNMLSLYKQETRVLGGVSVNLLSPR